MNYTICLSSGTPELNEVHRFQALRLVIFHYKALLHTMTERVYKIAVLGNEGVGKTALLVRFLCHRFIGEYDPTIEDCYQRKITVDGEEVTIDVLDTAYRNTPSKLVENFLHVGDGFIIVYSMTDRKSYITIPRYKEMIEESRDCTNQGPPSIVLIGNKTDLEEHRTVAKREGQTLAKRYGWLFGEASAAEYDGVDVCFYDLIREMRARRCKMNPSALLLHLNDLRQSSCSDTDSQTDESPSESKKKRFVKKKLSDSSRQYKRKLFGSWHHVHSK